MENNYASYPSKPQLFLIRCLFSFGDGSASKKIISDILNLEHIKTSEIAEIFPSMEPKDQQEKSVFITKETDIKNTVFKMLSMSTIFLRVLFEEVLISGKIIEARLMKAEKYVEFYIVSSLPYQIEKTYK